MKLPAMFRKKRADGKYSGSYRARVKGVEVNLGTSDAQEARKRLLEAVSKGRRNFVDEIDEAADATEAVSGEAAAAAAAAAPPPAATSPPLQPDAVIPPPPAPAPPLALPPATPADDARAEAEATNAAAAEGEADAGQAAAGDAGAELPPDVLDGFLTQGAEVVVDLQLELQAALIRKRTGKQPARVPDDSPVRQLAASAWVTQLKIWFPGDKMLPPWAMALILPAMCLPQQYASAVPIKPETPQPPAASGVETVAAAA